MDRKKLAVLAAVAAVALVSQAQANTYIYTSGTTWDSAAAWGGAGYPSQASDVADMTQANIVAATTVTANNDVSVGQLSIGDSDGLSNYTIATAAGKTFTFDNGSSAASLSILGVGGINTPGNTISASVKLNSDLNIILPVAANTNVSPTLTFSGPITLNSKTITISGGYTGTSDRTQFTFGGADILVGNGTIINNSDSPINVTGNKSSFTGTFILNGKGSGQDSNSSTLTLTGGGVNQAKEIIINGWADSTGTQQGGRLQIGTGSTNQTPLAYSRFNSAGKVTMNGGDFTYHAIAFSSTYSAQYLTDTIGTLDLKSGFSRFSTTASTAEAGTKLILNNIQREAGATAFNRAALNGKVSGVFADSGPKNGTSLFVGSTSTATNDGARGIVPWMMYGNSTSNFNTQGFATYDPATGFRGLTQGAGTESSGALANGANVIVGNVATLSQDWTINSLWITGSSVSTPGANRKITISSGGLMFNLTGAGIGAAGGGANSGIIAFPAGVEGVVMSSAIAGVHSIGAQIQSTGGLTKGGFGTLKLLAANQITGDTHVSGGTLQVGDGTAANNATIGSGDVYVDGGAILDIQNVPTAGVIDTIADTASVYLQTAGLYTGQIKLSGAETVGALYVNGVLQASGTYNSTSTFNGASPISGSGALTVVPEPIAASFLGVGLLFLGRRSRRR